MMVHCSNCGYEASDEMRFCPRCGARVRNGGRPAPAPPAALLGVEDSLPEFCSVECWHGYLKCDFVARVAGTGEEVARSPLFRWRQVEAPPRGGKALAAYSVLVERLRGLGWEPVGPARPWYAQRFRRSLVELGEPISAEEPQARPPRKKAPRAARKARRKTGGTS